MKISYINCLVIFTFFTVFTGCGQAKVRSSMDNINIELETVDFIKIEKQSNAATPLQKRLTEEQTRFFIEKLNNTKAIGLRKAIPSYFVDVHLKNGAKRSFVINGEFIKERSDYYYDLKDKDFIGSIWNDLPSDPIKNIKVVFENYIQHEESTDSADNKEVMVKNLNALTTLTNPEDFSLLIHVWMYYDPTDFPSRALVYGILQKNIPLSIEAVKERIKNKEEWESQDAAPYSELSYLLETLENN